METDLEILTVKPTSQAQFEKLLNYEPDWKSIYSLPRHITMKRQNMSECLSILY